MDWSDSYDPSLMREISILSALSSDDLKPNIKRLRMGKNLIFNKKYWEIIEKHKHNNIITGSCALIAFGLIDRDPSDIDLIPINESVLFNKGLHNKRYDGMDSEDMIGYYVYNNYRTSYYVDFFKNKNVNVITSGEYKFENPIDILKKKLMLKRKKISDSRKDNEDIVESIRNLS